MARIDPRRKDAAGIGPYAREREKLVPLSRLKGWNVIKGEADIRSWEVKTVSGRLLGVVRDLLIDTTGGEVVMIDVDLADSSRHACVPLRAVEIDRARRIVRADSADLEESELTEGARVADDDLTTRREVRYAESGERVIERKPIVEETVVRRRDPRDDDDLDAESRL